MNKTRRSASKSPLSPFVFPTFVAFPLHFPLLFSAIRLTRCSSILDVRIALLCFSPISLLHNLVIRVQPLASTSIWVIDPQRNEKTESAKRNVCTASYERGKERILSKMVYGLLYWCNDMFRLSRSWRVRRGPRSWRRDCSRKRKRISPESKKGESSRKVLTFREQRSPWSSLHLEFPSLRWRS